ncbi:hypothetical protein HMPREF0591_0740 [Mycobacterium parascrofulaceum ATCC BAA-614]|uniref:Lipoprotein n=1 Tax=Mycobacterium parascrofulaceum ATCC BAA-614 TaxID=525368 RepID=D5P3J6_9MYCO|nr:MULTISPECIES: hypothetical protein [Mycobacterium]EFG79348.1 hypothetical protein HMPREF0591_0740 [Mycobacterium parascrofulaceum ATCC BAA-614]OCB39815.1 hypothetical protein A9X02_17385 [Mycobacterium malmoense]
MRTSRTVAAGVAVLTALTVGVAGCGKKQPTPSPSKPPTSSSATASPGAAPTSSAPAQSSEYTGLLIQASDINAPIPFTATPPTGNPNGQPGVATTFKDEDGSHVIKDTIQVFADPGAATDALNKAKGAQGDVIKSATTQAATVGTGGTLLMGNSPDKSKGVTILMFTEGRAFVTIQFDGPPDTLAPADFVNDVGQKQDEAIKKGLGG